MVSATTARSSLPSASRSTSSRSRVPKRSSVRAASYLLRKKRRSTAAWIRVRAGRNNAATASVEAATARPELSVTPLNASCSTQDAAEVGERERRRQRTVDQRAVDHHVDVVEAVSQDRRPRGQGEHGEAETEHGLPSDVDPRGHIEGQRAHHGDARDGRGQDQPLHLLTLDPAGPPQPGPHAEGREDDGQPT